MIEMAGHYYYCSQCAVWIPSNFKILHMQKCNQRKFSPVHPFICDGQLIGRIGIINQHIEDNLDTNVQQSKSVAETEFEKWILCKEPEDLCRLQTKFSTKYAFFNNLDLLLSGLEAFYPVLIRAEACEQVFLCVPNDFVQSGTVAFYAEGIKNHFPISQETLFVEVKRIRKTELARSISLVYEESEDARPTQMANRILKQKYLHNYNFGNPFLVRKTGKIALDDIEIGPPSVKCRINSVEDIENDFRNLNLSESSLNLFSESESYQRKLLLSSPKNACDTINTLDLNQLNLTPNSKCNFSSPFKTSTPKKVDRAGTGISRSHLKSTARKVKGKKADFELFPSNASYVQDNNSEDEYVWLSKHSSIFVYQNNESFRLEKKEDSKSESYFKTETFYEVKNLIEKKLILDQAEAIDSIFWSGILLSGLPGTGKSRLIKEVAQDLSLNLISAALLGWTETGFKDTYFEECFKKAELCAPSVLLLEKIDSLCHVSEDSKNAVQEILRLLKKSKNGRKSVILTATTSQLDFVPRQLRQTGQFDKEIVLALPDPLTRFRIFLEFLKCCNHCVKEEIARDLSHKAAGFSGADLKLVVKLAWQKAVFRYQEMKKCGIEGRNIEMSEEDLKEGFETVVPFFLKQNCSVVSKVSWSDILGYEDVKLGFKEILEIASSGENSVDFRGMKGVLLYGPPGCAKTMLVKALVCETKFTFFSVRCSDLLSKYVGDTEKKLCQLFEKASLGAPSIIFMDEVDSLCGERAGSGSDASVVPELLSLLHETRRKSHVLVVGATNRPQAVDEALFSPGCLETLIHVDLPDCASRCAIWEGILADVPKEEVDVACLCARSEGFSCAEICSIYQKATQALLVQLQQGTKVLSDLRITQTLLQQAITCSAPRTPKSVLNSISVFKSSFRNKES